MASVVDYGLVCQRMHALGMRSLYYNSGAFGPAESGDMRYVGWIGPDDGTIRPEARNAARAVDAPYAQTLASLATRAWIEVFSGPVWVMPKSSWAYELDFGSKLWLPDALAGAGIDASRLAPRTDAPAIEFLSGEAERFTALVQTLLENLFGSDFMLAWPDHPVVCTVHHHKQLWWVTADTAIIKMLDRFVPENQNSDSADLKSEG